MRTLRQGMTGTDIMEIQSVLRRMGYDLGPPDGVFGPRTHEAVAAFQRRFGLAPDGVIGGETGRILERFLLGYDLYSVRAGDTFYTIAGRYGIDPQVLATANPDQNAGNLQVGHRISVPYGFDVVSTDVSYTYAVLTRNIQGLKARYPFLQVGSAGRSVLGKTLYSLRLGTGPNHVLFNAAHHALEWITSPLLMKFTEEFLKAYAKNGMMGGYSPRRIWSESSIFLVPMVNPDGVDLVLNGLQPENPNYRNLLRWNGGSPDFSQDWQANNRGVDLNHNYNAAWQLSKDAEEQYGITGPGPTRYSGPYPESEPETQAMVRFTRSRDPRLVIAYHTQGRVIYWNFQDMAPPEAEEIGRRMAEISGYTLGETIGIASYAGYKDWFIQDFRRPGYTVEVGLGKNPLPISQFNEIYRENEGLLLYASTVTA